MRNDFSDQNIKLVLPVSIKYSALDAVLKEKFTGELIKQEDGNESTANYAQILDISIGHSYKENFDIQLNVKFQFLTKLFKNKEGDAEIHISLQLDPSNQVLSVKDYSVLSKTGSWLADRLLQGLINSWLYNRIKSKMTVELTPIIESHLETINQKLTAKMEVSSGAYAIGNMHSVKLVEVIGGESHLHLSLDIKGYTEIEVDKIDL